MDIMEATERYEAWLRACLPVVIDADLEFKHQQMAAAVFPFFRATFYRWAERWEALCPHLGSVPMVLGVGDVHVENYGTWRDAEGRLIWGINDFDEATHLPYTADLVRLATSAALATNDRQLAVTLKQSAAAIVGGYQEGLAGGGQPFVLAERHPRLRRLASRELRDPIRFWSKMQALPEAAPAAYPPDALDAVVTTLPGGPGQADVSIRVRRAGLGSLGRPRLVAVSPWKGGLVAREAKAVLPSAWDWALGHDSPAVHYAEVVSQAVRCPDPHTDVRDRWLVRRRAPDSIRIELTDLPVERDEAALLRCMGSELANIHLGTPGAGPRLLEDLADRERAHPGWMVVAGERMAADTESDWKAWRGRAKGVKKAIV